VTIYYVLVISILLLNIIRKKGRISDKVFSVLACTMFIIIVGFRGKMVGADTWNYYDSFYAYSDYSLSEIIALNKNDFGFFIFQWFIQYLFHDFVFLNLAAAIIFYVPLAVFLHENSKDIGLSYIILMAFNFFQFSMTGTRQTMAFGFAIWAIRESMKEKPKILKVFFWVLIGTSFHRSCIIALLYPLLRTLANKKWTAHSLLPLVCLFFLFRSQITKYAISVLAPEAYKGYVEYVSGGGTTTYVIFIFLLFIGLFLLSKSEINRYRKKRYYLVLFGCAVAMQALVIENSIIFRVVWYFSIILTVYLPEVIHSKRLTRQSQVLISMVTYVGVLFMYLNITIASANVVPYQFFMN
jgi:hypothetical protein